MYLARLMIADTWSNILLARISSWDIRSKFQFGFPAMIVVAAQLGGFAAALHIGRSLTGIPTVLPFRGSTSATRARFEFRPSGWRSRPVQNYGRARQRFRVNPHHMTSKPKSRQGWKAFQDSCPNNPQPWLCLVSSDGPAIQRPAIIWWDGSKLKLCTFLTDCCSEQWFYPNQDAPILCLRHMYIHPSPKVIFLLVIKCYQQTHTSTFRMGTQCEVTVKLQLERQWPVWH